MSELDPRRRSFGPVVLLGLASAGTLALAGNQSWADVSADQTTRASLAATSPGTGEVPLALALGLVVLACWGVLLVTRRRARLLVAGIGLLASLGAVATVVLGRGMVRTDLEKALEQAGGPSAASVDFTLWIWVAGFAALTSVAVTALALRQVPGWPEMSSRYDAPVTAPGSAPAATVDGDTEQQHLDVWKSIDEGRDPTV